MPTGVFSSGPAAVLMGFPLMQGNFVYTTTFGNGYLLGWCERSPIITMNNAVTPLFNTLGGVELPYHYFHQGSEFEITCTLTRWNPALLDMLRNFYSTAYVAEYCFPHQLGTKAISIGIYYPLVKAVGFLGHRLIDYFPIVRIARMVNYDLGTQGEKVEIVFHAMRVHAAPVLVAGLNPQTASAVNVFGSLGAGAARLSPPSDSSNRIAADPVDAVSLSIDSL